MTPFNVRIKYISIDQIYCCEDATWRWMEISSTLTTNLCAYDFLRAGFPFALHHFFC